MLWDSVELKRGALVFTQGKSGREIEIPLHPELKRWLSDRAGSKKPKTGAVFPDLRGIGTWGRSGRQLHPRQQFELNWATFPILEIARQLLNRT